MNDKQFLTLFIIVLVICGGLIAYMYFKPQIETGENGTQQENQSTQTGTQTTQQQETTTTQEQETIETYQYNQSSVLYFTDYAVGLDAGSGDEDTVSGGDLNSLKHEDGNYLIVYSTTDNAPEHTWLLLLLYSDPCPWSNIIVVITYYYSAPVDGAVSLYYFDEYGKEHQYVLKTYSVEPTTRTRFEFQVTVIKGSTLRLEFAADYDAGEPFYLYVDFAIVKEDTATTSWLSFVGTPEGLTIICLTVIAVSLTFKHVRRSMERGSGKHVRY